MRRPKHQVTSEEDLFVGIDLHKQRWHVKRLAGRSPAGVGPRVAQAQSRRHDFTDCVLASNLFGLRNLGRLRDG